MEIKAVLLDLGNVVLGVDGGRVLNYWSSASSTSPEVLRSLWSIDEQYERLEKGEIDFKAYSSYLSIKFEISLPYQQWITGWNKLWTQPIKPTINLLPKIASNYELYALTNTNRIHADFFKNEYSSELSHFKHLFISNEIGLRKPEPECFNFVCDYIGLDPQQILFLDDTATNVRAARDTGILAKHVEKPQNGEEILNDFLEIPNSHEQK